MLTKRALFEQSEHWASSKTTSFRFSLATMNLGFVEWIEARDVLTGKGLVAINANPDIPAAPGYQG
jgi:hypothetical protein